MILNRPNEEFVYNGISYRIGDRIIGTDSSEYHGLLGSITEIRDGDDKTTENETPDIYCRFDVPILSYEILELEKRFSELYQCKKTIDDIALDEVIMAPEMIQRLRDLDSRQRAFDIYMISEDWAVNGASGHSVFFCTDLDMAKRILYEKVGEEQNSGCVLQWKDEKNVMVESGNGFYECWLDGFFFENHYRIAISHESLLMSDSKFGLIGRRYIDESRVEDFISQTQQTEAVDQLSEKQYQDLIKDPHIPERIHKALGNNDSYWESYWDTISAVIEEEVKNCLDTNTEKEI